LVSYFSLDPEWKKMQAASVKFVNVKGSTYRHMDYQVYVAASMFKIVSKNQIVVAKFIAGQGKTFIVLLIAQVHVKARHEVTIVVLNDDLLEQYEADIAKYFDHDEKVTVVTAENLRYDSAGNDGVYIVDEVDRIAKDHAISFRR
jgi:superfamily II DNA or RNA helicase